MLGGPFGQEVNKGEVELMKQETENKNPLKWFFLGIGIAFLPFVVMLVQAAVESNNQLDGLIEILKKYTAITTFFTTPLSLIIAIIGGGMAYRKYFEDKEKEQKNKSRYTQGSD